MMHDTVGSPKAASVVLDFLKDESLLKDNSAQLPIFCTLDSLVRKSNPFCHYGTYKNPCTRARFASIRFC